MTEKPKAVRRRRKAHPPTVEIREMRLDDLPAVFALGQRLFTAEDLPTLYRCWDDDEVMQLFSSDQETCLVLGEIQTGNVLHRLRLKLIHANEPGVGIQFRRFKGRIL